MKGAMAIFAKTPGLSPVKTRLAQAIGQPLAETFYFLSLSAIESVVSQVQQSLPDSLNVSLNVYWALAEQISVNASNPLWKRFPKLWTGQAGLGHRLANIYSQLQSTHDYVVMIGTDSPQLSPQLLFKAIKKVISHPKRCVIGPCIDGGFYFFGASLPIPNRIWTQVTYSTFHTLSDLKDQLAIYGIPMDFLTMQFDVDTVRDLEQLYKALTHSHNLLPSQQRLHDWLLSQAYVYLGMSSVI